MSDGPCAICGADVSSGYTASLYTPYVSHADKSVCVENIRADERERIAQAIDEFASHVEDGGWYIVSLGDAFRAASRIARGGD